LGVVHVDLDQQGARRGSDRSAVADQAAVEHLARIFIERHRGRRTGLHGGGVDLRHSHVDTQRLGRSHMEQFGRRRAGPGVDQVTDIGVACGDIAIKWSIDVFIGLHLLQPRDVGLS